MDDKVDLKSLDIQKDKVEQLKKAFPEVVTEGKVDFERLKNELGEEIETGKERYEMKWPGKANLQKIIQEPSIGTLKPVKEDSVDFDTTENLFIEGDSLEVLKLLQKSYYGKVKMIYIDPPYNTGKDFIYPDNYTESLDTYLRYTGQKGEEGLKLTTNAETEGRYHSKWLNMMYPRLFLARNLLKEDGVIFISIDDHEIDNLKKICNEIFGEENFIAQIPVVMNLKGNQDAFGFAETHEYFLVYSKQKDLCEIGAFEIEDEDLDEWLEDEYGIYKIADNLRATGVNAPRLKRPNLWYPIFISESKNLYTTENNQPLNNEDTIVWPINPEGEELSWYWSKNTLKDKKHNLILKNTQNGFQFYRKQRPQIGDSPTKKPKSFFYKPEYSTSTATVQLKELMGGRLFDTPKPLPFISDLVKIGAKNDAIILDFFSGSATTAHSVLEINQKDGGNRKFIMVQLQEPTIEDSEAFKAGYKNIAEIGIERIKRVIKKIKDENAGKLEFEDKKLDLGFKIFRLEESNFKIWNKKSDVPLQQQLPLAVSNIQDDSSDEEILYEIILKSGFELSVPVEKLEILGKSIYSVDNKSLLICLENDLTQEFIKEVSGLEAQRVVFLDRGFSNNDQLKTNTVELMKVKGVEFKTV